MEFHGIKVPKDCDFFGYPFCRTVSKPLSKLYIILDFVIDVIYYLMVSGNF